MGKIELEESGEFVVDILEYEKHAWLNRLGAFLRIPFLDQQVRAVLKVSRYDALYLPYPLANSRLLSLLKWMRLLSVPIVVLGHQGFQYYGEKDTLFNRILKKGYQQFDHFAFFSKKLLEKTKNDLGFSQEYVDKHFHYVHWGPDRKFYQNHVATKKPQDFEPFAVCAGTVDRDYDMLIAAFEKVGHPLKIFCTEQGVSSSKVLPPNVSVDNSWVPYPVLMEAYQASGFVIIPIRDAIKNRGNTFGLTVLNDCIAMGKPVLMTYHPYVDIDIEKENIGLWVKDNTVTGWEQALNRMFSLSDSFPQMEENARKLYRTRYHSGIFGQEMAEIFKKAI
ncbi:hypothetical protein [Cyclobacterium xiamenense]|uniref:hypothetical protein n=1 Tax=Cyclobacterium xiamenense TaxID=1297121 RepID=UPI0035CF9E64